MSSCIAFAGLTDVVSNAIGMFISAIANGILGMADFILTPLFSITTMKTTDIAAYVPGFNSNDGGVGGFFSKAIGAIATTVAGVLITCRVITYLIDLMNGEKLEPVSKLIWNAVFGIVLTITGKTLLSIFFDEIISPLSTALADGVLGSDFSFSFASTGRTLTGLGDAADGFQLGDIPKLFVVILLLIVIGVNLVKLGLECAERYIICIVTIALSPLAFATAVTDGTKQTAKNWFEAFWAQSVLLILNIWVVGVAKTALANDMSGSNMDAFVKWALITYAYLKIAQRLDDMMQTAGLKVTRTGGLDVAGELRNTAMNTVAAAGAAVSAARGLYSGTKKIGAVGGKAIEGMGTIARGGATAVNDGKNKLEAYSKASRDGDLKMPDKKEGQTPKEIHKERSDAKKAFLQAGNVNQANDRVEDWQNASTPKAKALAKLNNDKSAMQGVEKALQDNGMLQKGAKVESFSEKNGKLYANAIKEDKTGTHMSQVELKSKEGKLTPTGAKSKLDVAPDGKSATLKTENGTFSLKNKEANREDGQEIWEATQTKDAAGNDISEKDRNKQQFFVPEDDLNNNLTSAETAAQAFSASENGEQSVEEMLTGKASDELKDSDFEDDTAEKAPTQESAGVASMQEEVAPTAEIEPTEEDNSMAVVDAEPESKENHSFDNYLSSAAPSTETADSAAMEKPDAIAGLYDSSADVEKYENAQTDSTRNAALNNLNKEMPRDGIQDALIKENAMPRGATVESVTANNGQLQAHAVKRDSTGTTITSVGITNGNKGVETTGPVSTTQISPSGKTVTLTNSEGTFEFQNKGTDKDTGRTSWEVTQTSGKDGAVIPEAAQTTQTMQVDGTAGQNNEQAAIAATEAFSKSSDDTPSVQDTLVANTQAETANVQQESMAAVQQFKATSAPHTETAQPAEGVDTPTAQAAPEEREQASAALNTTRVRAGVQQTLSEQGSIGKDETVRNIRTDDAGKIYATMAKEVDGNTVEREAEVTVNNGNLSLGKETYNAKTYADGTTIIKTEAGTFGAKYSIGDEVGTSNVTVSQILDSNGQYVEHNGNEKTRTIKLHNGDDITHCTVDATAYMNSGDGASGGTAVTEHQLEAIDAQTTQPQNSAPQTAPTTTKAGSTSQTSAPTSAKPQKQEKTEAPSSTAPSMHTKAKTGYSQEKQWEKYGRPRNKGAGSQKK